MIRKIKSFVNDVDGMINIPSCILLTVTVTSYMLYIVLTKKQNIDFARDKNLQLATVIAVIIVSLCLIIRLIIILAKTGIGIASVISRRPMKCYYVGGPAQDPQLANEAISRIGINAVTGRIIYGRRRQNSRPVPIEAVILKTDRNITVLPVNDPPADYGQYAENLRQEAARKLLITK